MLPDLRARALPSLVTVVWSAEQACYVPIYQTLKYFCATSVPPPPRLPSNLGGDKLDPNVSYQPATARKDTNICVGGSRGIEVLFSNCSTCPHFESAQHCQWYVVACRGDCATVTFNFKFVHFVHPHQHCSYVSQY